MHRAFCAGADLKAVVAETSADALDTTAFLTTVHTLLAKIRGLPMPLIAALNGITAGGGLELAMSCDFIVAAEQPSIDAALALEIEANRSHCRSHDMKEGMTAFAQRRKPEFLGR
jgi:enoyl-CoA hydratase/carnithine racemase